MIRNLKICNYFFQKPSVRSDVSFCRKLSSLESKRSPCHGGGILMTLQDAPFGSVSRPAGSERTSPECAVVS